MSAALRKIQMEGARQDWETPQDFFERLNREFMFGLDACSDIENFKVGTFLDKD